MAAKRRARTTKPVEEIAAGKIHKPSEHTSSPRIVVYGRFKKGKTFFIASAKDPDKNNLLILDPERGTQDLTSTDPDVWPVNMWEDVDPFLKFVRSHHHSYDWIALDGMTKLHKMALNFVRRQAEERDLDRRPGLVTKKDYGDAGQLVQDLVWQISQLPQGIIFAVQERLVGLTEFDEDEGEEEQVTMKVPDLPQGVRSYLLGEVDVIARIYVQPVRVRVKKTGEEKTLSQRRLWIGDHLRYDTGFRSELKMPDMIKNPSVPKLVALLKGEKEQATDG